MQRAASVESDVPCPESATSPASGGWFGMRPSGADRAGSPAGRGGSRWQPKTRCGVLCHENTTSLLSVFGPGNRQHVRRLKSNGAESRDRKGFSAEALPYRQTAGGSCRGKDGKRAALDPNGSGHAVVQPGTAGNRWKMVGSSVGSRGGYEWCCHSRWFCVVSRITAPAVGLFHHGARLRDLAGSCAIKAKGTARALLDSVHTVDTGNGPALQTKNNRAFRRKSGLNGGIPYQN